MVLSFISIMKMKEMMLPTFKRLKRLLTYFDSQLNGLFLRLKFTQSHYGAVDHLNMMIFLRKIAL